MKKDFIKNMPKVELHLHLEGSIPLDVLWTLIHKYSREDEIPNYQAFKEKFVYKGFPEFLETWKWMIQFINEYEDFTLIAEGVMKSMIQQHFQYAEIFFAPARMLEKGLDPAGIAEAIYKGLTRNKNSVKFNLIPDLSRDFGSRQAERILDSVAGANQYGVVAVGMGGTESKYPASEYAKVFEKARKYGLFTTAHAGENTGPDKIWDVIQNLKVDRIGHGTSAYKDKKLLKYLAKTQLHLECCPISNVKTGVIPSLQKHPIQIYMIEGLNVSVNTDDPTFFNYNLGEELDAVAEAFNMGPEEIYILQSNAIRSSFCDDSVKVELMKNLDNYFNRAG